MENSSLRSRGLEWFTSHALWELGKWILEKAILPAIFAALISLGYARMVHAALGTAFNVFLILLGIIGLVWTLGFIPSKNKSAQQARQVAIDRIGKLLTLGDLVVAQVPSSGATASDFCRFWSEEMQRWSQQVGTLLTDNWGEEELHAFFSTRGIQYDLPVLRIHPEAVTNYHQFSRWLQNLEHLKQTLPRS
jgi:hypothetical protein